MPIPPPGSPEVTNTICDDIPGTGFPYPDATICDDWDWTDDETPGSNWVESEYAIEMNSLTEFTLDMEFAIHEFNRTAIGLDSVDLGSNSMLFRMECQRITSATTSLYLLTLLTRVVRQ